MSITGGIGGGSNIPPTQALPEGYEYRRNSTSENLELWKVDIDPEVLITEQNVAMFDVNGSLRTLLNTIFLENSHSISANGQNVAFKNLNSNIFFVPSQWTGHFQGGQNMIRNQDQNVNEYIERFNLYGEPTATVLPLSYNVISPINFVIYKIYFKSAEAYQGILTLEVVNSAGDFTFRVEDEFDLQDGDEIIFDDTFFVLLKDDNVVVDVKKEDGTVINSYGASIETQYPFIEYDVRLFDTLQNISGVQYINADNPVTTNRHYFVELTNSITMDVEDDIEYFRVTDFDRTFTNSVFVTVNIGALQAFLGTRGDDVTFFKDFNGDWRYFNQRNNRGGLV